eukprot:Seg594.6 transcript_id=Seg594.6/GoldUCD/mRNA.D3Y31 product="hypothetical protein" protein_id=Seg594.6/GoldUCD/D3Y31
MEKGQSKIHRELDLSTDKTAMANDSSVRGTTQRNDSIVDSNPDQHSIDANNKETEHATQLRAALADTHVSLMNGSKEGFDIHENQEHGDERSREEVSQCGDRSKPDRQNDRKHSSNLLRDEEKELAAAKNKQNLEDLLLMADRDDQTVVINIKHASW